MKRFIIAGALTLAGLSAQAQRSTNAPILPPSVVINLSTNAPQTRSGILDTNTLVVSGAGYAAVNQNYTNVFGPFLFYRGVNDTNFILALQNPTTNSFLAIKTIANGNLYTNKYSTILLTNWVAVATNTLATNPAPVVAYATNYSKSVLSTNSPILHFRLKISEERQDLTQLITWDDIPAAWYQLTSNDVAILNPGFVGNSVAVGPIGVIPAVKWMIIATVTNRSGSNVIQYLSNSVTNSPTSIF